MTISLATAPPDSPSLTPYDEARLIDYLRLLDADAEGAAWDEAMRIIFEIDPDSDRSYWQSVHASHLARAKWMTTTGYRQLLTRGS